MYTIFSMLGADLSAEQQTSDGMDMVVKTHNSIYVFELKSNKSAHKALQQIDLKDYAASFAEDQRPIVKVGISFSGNQRSIDEWEIKKY